MLVVPELELRKETATVRRKTGGRGQCVVGNVFDLAGAGNMRSRPASQWPRFAPRAGDIRCRPGPRSDDWRANVAWRYHIPLAARPQNFADVQEPTVGTVS